MKRSEAVKIIASVLTEYFEVYENETADRILKEMEALGMAPPLIEEESFKILDSGEMTYDVRYWEDE